MKEEGTRRLGVIVTRKTGGAVVRNRWKRMIREMFRHGRELLPPSTDHVVIVRGSTKGSPDPEAHKELKALFEKIGKR